MASTYLLKNNFTALSQNLHILTLFNPSGSGKIVKIYRVWVQNNRQGLGITGVICNLNLYYCTAASSGKDLIPISYDSTNTALGTIIAGTGKTVTNGSLLRRITISSDETDLTGFTIDEFVNYKNISEIWNTGTRNSAIQPLVLRENLGLTLQNITSTTVSGFDAFFEFTVE